MIDSKYWAATAVTTGLSLYIIISYTLQHLRIIRHRTSEGLSPSYLFVNVIGFTSNALIVMLQSSLDSHESQKIPVKWGVLPYCSLFSSLTCPDMNTMILLTILPWVMVSTTFILYFIYFPQYLKPRDVNANADSENAGAPLDRPYPNLGHERSVSFVLGLTAVISLIVGLIFTTCVWVAYSHSPNQTLPPFVHRWATFLSMISVLFSAVQWIPQIVFTYRLKLVMALSVPGLCFQTVAAIFMCIFTAVSKPWTSWIAMTVSSILQLVLLILCLACILRCRRLHIDDYGNPLVLIPGERTHPSAASSTTRYGAIVNFNSRPGVADTDGVSVGSSDALLAAEHMIAAEGSGSGASDSQTLRRHKRPECVTDLQSGERDKHDRGGFSIGEMDAMDEAGKGEGTSTAELDALTRGSCDCEESEGALEGLASNESTPMDMDKRRSSRPKRSGKARKQPRSEVVWFAM